MAPSSSSLTFIVLRSKPELVAPAIPTPHETKSLYDIDDQDYMRFHFSVAQFYRNKSSSMAEKEGPVRVIREALAQTLVYYYPFAGRLREEHGCKLVVDCTGEGVLFVEADADVTIDEFGDDSLQHPFQYSQELLCDVPGSKGITNFPLLLIQVTRLKCGGFVLAIRWNYTICDGAGLSQFMNTWAEMARGAHKPSILPLWRRELLMARNPPRITCNHREYDQGRTIVTTNSHDNMHVHQSFFLGPAEIASVRHLVPSHLKKCTTFDVVTACLWRCHTKALQIEEGETVRMMCIVNARTRFNPPLPVGYYGNAFALPVTVTTAGELCGNPFGYAVELLTISIYLDS